MKHSRRAVAALAAVVAAFSFAGGASVTSAAPDVKGKGRQRPHRADSLLVKFRREVDPAVADELSRSLGAREVRRFNRPRWMTRAAIDGWRRLKLEPDQDLDAIRREVASRPEVEVVEPDYILTIDQAAEAVPNDPYFPNLWGLHNTGQFGGTPGADIRADQAWDFHTGSSSVVVAVIDTGVYYSHPDLAPNMWVNTGEIPGNGIDDDGNGYVDDVHGYDFVNGDGDPLDDHGHGTHVAGTIAAVGNNGVGVVGVSWHARIMAVKFLNSFGSGTTSDAVSAVLYAANNHAKVMNNSWGGGGFSQALKDAISTANASGALFVAAAGNAADDNDAFPNYPSNYDVPNVVAVAATDESDHLAYFSNFGKTTVDLGAPGVDIFSTATGVPSAPLFDPSGYLFLNGTSMATPQVSGAAALVLARFPGISVAQLKDRLLNGVDQIAAMAGITVTGGRLDVANALEDDTVPPSPVTDLAVTATGARSVTLSWTATGDDGLVGRATRYDLRYATFEIDGNFSAATPVTDAPTPVLPGAVQTFQVKGLQPSTTYYLAVRVIDNVGNASGLSGVVSTTTTPVVTVFQDDFSAASGWTVTGTNGLGGPSLWHLSSHRHSTPPFAFYYGREDTLNYSTGATNSGAITSPSIDLCVVDPALSFQHFLQTENLPPYDTARVSVSDDGGLTWTPLYSTAVGTVGMESKLLQLNAFEGKVIRLRFDFDTVDAILNAFEGWVVDDVRVSGGTPTGPFPPQVRVGGPYVVMRGVPLALSSAGSRDCDGSIASYAWNFGDGTTGAGAAPVHVYNTPGIYTVTLVVTDSQGMTASASTTVDVRTKVFWKNVVGASATADALTKTGMTTAWDAGAVSGRSILSGSGFVEWTAMETNTWRMAGLSHGDSGVAYADIDFAVFLRADGKFEVYEGETNQGSFGMYGVGDVFRVQVDAGVVTYKRNGVVFYTSSALATYPLLVDTSLWSPGARISNAVMSGNFGPNVTPVANAGGPYAGVTGAPVTFDGTASSDANGAIVGYAWTFGDGATGTGASPAHAYASAGSYTVSLTVTDDDAVTSSATSSVAVTAPPPVVGVLWTQLVGASAPSNTLTKTGSTMAWDAGAVSAKSIMSGSGFVEWTAMETNTWRMAGLSHGNSGTAYADIDFAVFLRADGKYEIYEGETNRGMFGTYGVGDVFRVQVDSGVVRYKRNGALVYTSAIVATYPLLLDTSLLTPGARVSNAAISGNFGPSQPPVANAGGPYAGVTGAPVTFDGTASNDPNGAILSYSWDFGDGSTGTGTTPTHTYAAVGSYTVTLTVQDEEGLPATAMSTVTVTGPPPVVGVLWTQLVGASAPSNTLTKTGSTMAWDAGAVSAKSIMSGSGFVEWTAMETNTWRMAGLSHGNSGTAYADIDFAVFLRADGKYEIYEGETNRGMFGTYGVGDVFRVQVDSGVVRYKRNGALVYTSAIVATYPLLLDTSLLTPGARVSNAAISGNFGPSEAPVANAGGPYAGVIGEAVTFDGTASSDANGIVVSYSWDFGDGIAGTGATPPHAYASIGTYTVTLTVLDDEGASSSATSTVTVTAPPAVVAVVWTDLVGGSAPGNTLTKSATTTAWDAGAASSESILSGSGYVEFTAMETNTWRMAGLSHGNSGTAYADIDFAVFLRADGKYEIYEGETNRGMFGTYGAGDVFRVQVDGGVVRCKRNGMVFYTSAAAATYPLLADTSLYSSGATIGNAMLSGALGP